MDCPLRVAPGEPPTAPEILKVQAARTFATMAWVETALEKERRAMELRHVEFLRQLEDHLGTISKPPSETSALVWPSDHLPGCVAATDGVTAPPPEPEPKLGASTVPRPHWQPEQHHKLENDCQADTDRERPATADSASTARPLTADSITTLERPDTAGSVHNRLPTPFAQASPVKTANDADPMSPVSSERPRKSHSKKMGQVLGENEEHDIHASGILGLFEWLVKSTQFEMVFSGLIMANTVVMCFEAQYTGLHTGHEISYSNMYAHPGTTVWPGAAEAFVGMEWLFGCLFTLELLIKTIGLRAQFVKDVWNGIDSVIVISWLLTALRAVQLPLNPVMLRLCRLARLLRLLRLVRTIRGFDKLYLITTAMRGSASILMWSIMMLVIVQAMLSLFFQAVLEPYVLEAPLDDPDKRPARMEVYRFYGTFARNMLTMFEITLGNWMPPARALVENVDEWYMLFFLAHKLVIGFALVAVLNGVFIQETFKVAAMDDKVMMLQRERSAKVHSAKMHELFVHADQDGNGDLSKPEFIEALETPAIQQWLSAMELDVQDAGVIFDLVDVDQDGTLTATELVKGAGRLKGAARSIDVVSMIRDQKELQREIFEMKKVVLSSQGQGLRSRTNVRGYS